MTERIGFAQGVFAVKPTKFCTNKDALNDNKFMNTDHDEDCQEFNEQIQLEHEQFIQNIIDADIKANVLVQQSDDAPDAIFPDWFTCYKGDSVPDGVLILHPMFYQTRRNERSPKLIQELSHNFKHVIDLTHFEEDSRALEGKGAIVFDHRNRRFYCALSNRSNIDVINELVQKFNEICVDGENNPYKAITFEAYDENDDIIYHTDCMLSLHEDHALICLKAIKKVEQKAEVVKSLTKAKHPVKLIMLTHQQIGQMSANAQCVSNEKDEPCIIQSQRGFNALTRSQRKILKENYKMVVSKVNMIESVGGGSCRCLLVENWGNGSLNERKIQIKKQKEQKIKPRFSFEHQVHPFELNLQKDEKIEKQEKVNFDKSKNTKMGYLGNFV